MVGGSPAASIASKCAGICSAGRNCSAISHLQKLKVAGFCSMQRTAQAPGFFSTHPVPSGTNIHAAKYPESGFGMSATQPTQNLQLCS